VVERKTKSEVIMNYNEIELTLVEDTGCDSKHAAKIIYVARVLNKKFGPGSVAAIDMKSWAYNGISEFCMSIVNSMKTELAEEARLRREKRQKETTEFCRKAFVLLDRAMKDMNGAPKSLYDCSTGIPVKRFSTSGRN
jgi:hypothetical protein